MQMHEMLEYWSVDEVIECLSLGDNHLAVEKELLAAMPDAYNRDWTTSPEIEPGKFHRETPPEPDADHDKKLKFIWDKLSEPCQTAINTAATKEFGVDLNYDVQFPKNSMATYLAESPNARERIHAHTHERLYKNLSDIDKSRFLEDVAKAAPRLETLVHDLQSASDNYEWQANVLLAALGKVTEAYS